MLVPRPVGWTGELPDSGSTIGDEKQRPVPRLSYHASGTPPPNVAEYNKNTTIRRIYNKAIHFFEMSVLFETGELNAYAFTMAVGSADGNTFRTEDKERTTTITLADGKLLPCLATRV